MKSIEQITREQIIAKMNEKNISQMELARRTGLPHQSIYKIVHGKRFPSLAVLEKITLALEVPLSKLVSRKDHDEMDLSKEDIFEVLKAAVSFHRQKSAFEGLTRATFTQMTELIYRFGGWNFLYDFIVEEMAIREEAERDYRNLRDSLKMDVSPEEISKIKNKMIISKMIAKSR